MPLVLLLLLLLLIIIIIIIRRTVVSNRYGGSALWYNNWEAYTDDCSWWRRLYCRGVGILPKLHEILWLSNEKIPESPTMTTISSLREKAGPPSVRLRALLQTLATWRTMNVIIGLRRSNSVDNTCGEWYDGRTMLTTAVVWRRVERETVYCIIHCVQKKTSTPLGLPPLGHIWDVMLVWRKGNINKNCLCVTLLHCILPVLRHLSLIMTLITIYVFI